MNMDLGSTPNISTIFYIGFIVSSDTLVVELDFKEMMTLLRLKAQIVEGLNNRLPKIAW